jgi:2'-5' RNA ligase
MVQGAGDIQGALWLRPTGPLLERLQEIIRRLTARFGGAWPKPHVSILSGIELSRAGAGERLAELAARLRPIPIRLGKLEGRNEHFRCFYAAVDLCPELEEAYRAAQEVFGVHPTEPFEPHLSLLYGRLDAPTKAHLARELGGRLNLAFTASSIQLVNATSAVPVASWHTLHECPLRRPRRGEHGHTRSANL